MRSGSELMFGWEQCPCQLVGTLSSPGAQAAAAAAAAAASVTAAQAQAPVSTAVDLVL